ncbi:tumor necrosis factor receptor superfamily member EDAR-like isoform X2 [Lingula anatina]|uniref:Tumor necrosis factor receptor superfamily member EDAR-like isoform X2 n=1 Tax=Lingula anatina TaxID=7574 RepID=A0A2R2MPD7_LINAN|nr:tumor necrosis factor receptor superfamily member EDAR-like isoform X2 [Lingula anatina]|eukprot:XP_023932106.1 tumor necrosis factor receptor superfamily member EDAR-like isoform X2 [Lingula anatina]
MDGYLDFICTLLVVVQVCVALISQPVCDEFIEFKQSVGENAWKCVPCTRCAPGNGTLVECSGFNDTVCTPCEDGKTFSYDYVDSRDCLPCSACYENSVILKPCDVYHDVECGSCKKGYYFSAELGICVRNSSIRHTAVKTVVKAFIRQPKSQVSGFINETSKPKSESSGLISNAVIDKPEAKDVKVNERAPHVVTIDSPNRIEIVTLIMVF